MHVKALLIQARDTPDIEAQEQACFLERCGLRPSQLHTLNVTRDALLPTALDTCDLMIIGGAGEYSAQNDYPWMPALLDLVRLAYERNLPTFGSCWGHQVIARALGGEVVYDQERTEMGCGWIELNDAGQADPLFSVFPARFRANMGHHDRVSQLPEDAVNLAFSDTQQNQAFRIQDKPIYGTQFHSELDAHREKERLLAYRSYYTEVETEEAFQAIIDGLAETTEVDGLLARFIELYVSPTTSSQF